MAEIWGSLQGALVNAAYSIGVLIWDFPSGGKYLVPILPH